MKLGVSSLLMRDRRDGKQTIQIPRAVSTRAAQPQSPPEL